MAKRGKNRRGGDARLRLVHSDEVEQRVEAEAELHPLMHQIRIRMRDRDPMALLAFVSSIVAATDGRYGFEDRSPAALEDLIDTFIDLDMPETTAALHILAALAPRHPMRARAASTVERRLQPMPTWVSRLPETTITDAASIGFETEPGQNFLVEYRWPGGDLATYVVFDEGLGRGVKDAFPTAEPLAAAATRMQAAAPDGLSLTFRQLDLATARATLEESIANGEDRPIDEENDTWPSGRPFLEWLLGLMPAGGTPDPSTTSLPGFPDLHLGARPLGPDADDVIDDFAESDEGAAIGFDPEDVHDDAALQTIVDYAGLLGAQDPLEWSPGRVRELLDQYLPSVALPDPKTAHRMQPVLEAYLRFACRRTNRTSKQRDGLLRAARATMPRYLDIALSAQAQALRRALIDYDNLTGGLGDFEINVIGADPGEAANQGSGRLSLTITDQEVIDRLLADAARKVGGPDELQSLDDTPLPDEPFDASQLPEDIRDRVEQVRRLVDDFADRSFGVEFRTACRRYLARVAAAEPGVFRRAGRAETAAAAVVWTIGRANHLVARGGSSMTAQDLLAHFGLKGSVSQRAHVLMRGLPSASYDEHGPNLGTPDLLVSSMRAELIDLRDRAATGRMFTWD
ncbi:MAG: DUF6398 domain-containing protein [Intrasporangium sp.]|uniref:DUF6398 domain-containing protein n=1 Tax=Intrasporangium sp. TaxID=1925024 RepID=UPI003F7E12E0